MGKPAWKLSQGREKQSKSDGECQILRRIEHPDLPEISPTGRLFSYRSQKIPFCCFFFGSVYVSAICYQRAKIYSHFINE